MDKAYVLPLFSTLLFAVEGTWNSWAVWGTCSASCGTGTQSRTRSFSGGMPCSGSSTDAQNCQGATEYIYLSVIAFLTKFELIFNAQYSWSVEGSWATWGGWSTCSTTCDSDGTVTRTRNYTGGIPCSGSAGDTVGCQSEMLFIIKYKNTDRFSTFQ